MKPSSRSTSPIVRWVFAFRRPKLGRANRDGDGLLLADENHQPLAARDAGIEEISLQHGVVLGQDRDDHGGIFGALALVDGGGIGRNSVSSSPKP